jgi:hypothetical protein
MYYFAKSKFLALVTLGALQTTTAAVSAPLSPATEEQIRSIIAQSALSSCYLLKAGVNPKTAYTANSAAAMSHLKDTGMASVDMTDERIRKLSKLISFRIARASTRICPELVPANVKASLDKVEALMKERRETP